MKRASDKGDWGNFITCNIQHTQFVKHFLFSELVLIDIVIEPSQSSIKSYASARPLQPPQELLDRNPFNWAIETMQPFTLFDNPLFRPIWYDIPGIFASMDLVAHFLALWTRNLSRLVHD
jgi:hypothetical protein